MVNWAEAGLVIVGHGSTVNPDSSIPTHQHADSIRSRGLFAEVHCAFWKEEPSLREILRMVAAEQIYVVPNFISEGYFTETVIPRELELSGPTSQIDGKMVHYCSPVGNDPRMTELILLRAEEVAPKVPKTETTLLVVGHGTGLNENSAVASKREVELIGRLDLYEKVAAAYMEEQPLISNWRTMTHSRHVVVVPFFISDGLHSYEDIPVLLGIAEEPAGAASQSGLFRQNPHRFGSQSLYYANAIGTHPLMAEMLVSTVARFDAASHPAPV